MATTVGVRELRQNLSKYLARLKQGEDFVVTERGREVARLTPSGPQESATARLAARGARMASGDLVEWLRANPRETPYTGRPVQEILDEQREDRL